MVSAHSLICAQKDMYAEKCTLQAASEAKGEKMSELLVAEDVNKTYKKSNILIGGKYRSSLLENQLMAISLSLLDVHRISVEDGALVQRIKVADLQKLMHIKGNSFHDRLSSAAESLTGKTVGFDDGENFDYVAIIIRATKEGGVFTIRYNPDVENYILNLKSNYTVLNLEQTLKFKRSVYSFRLYELLRSRAYFHKGEEKTKDKVFEIKYNLSELKLAIGVINAENERVKKVLKRSKNPDYEKAAEASTEKVLEDWRAFKRIALDKPIAEINEITDINVTYKTIKQGQGGKICGIVFYVTYKIPDTPEKIDKEKFIEDVSDMMDIKITVRELKSVCEEAGYQMDIIREAYQYLCSYGEPIGNATGFLIDYIKKGGYKKNEVLPKNPKKAYNFESEHVIDYDKLMEQQKEILLKKLEES